MATRAQIMARREARMAEREYTDKRSVEQLHEARDRAGDRAFRPDATRYDLTKYEDLDDMLQLRCRRVGAEYVKYDHGRRSS